MNSLKLNGRVMEMLANIRASLEFTVPTGELQPATMDMSAFGGCNMCTGSCDVGCEGSCSGDCSGGFSCGIHIPGCQIF